MDYIPDRGDIVWLAFDLQAGHEQTGRRPAIVVSPAAYNRKVGLALFCPITTRKHGYPFEVALPESTAMIGVVLSDQIRDLDWKARRAEFVYTADAAVVAESRVKSKTLI